MRTLLLFIVSFLCINANAQEYKPLLIDGRTWEVIMPGDGIYLKDLRYTYTVCGDTIVEGKTCKRIHRVCLNPEDAGSKIKECYYSAYEHDRKVYHTDWGFKKILDFNIHLGDRINNKSQAVTCEDSIEVRGVKYRRLRFDRAYGGEYYSYWVEGIGSRQDFWFYGGRRPISGYNYSNVIACYDNGKLTFNWDDFSKEAIPTNISTLDADRKKESPTYNTMGQRISKPRKGEICIRDGKKVIMR